MLSRRGFLQGMGAGIVAFNLPVWAGNAFAGISAPRRALALRPPDANGVMLPEGFTSKILAASGQKITGHTWHGAPDGGAVFKRQDGGWIYVSNAELEDGAGGVSAIRFDKGGNVLAAYPILKNTSRNCAGGATPWGTWLSCEEHEEGLVWECDPEGKRQAIPRPALGVFRHEAAAVDPASGMIYLTEDLPDGAFYRYVPENGLEKGALQVLILKDGAPAWQDVPNPAGGLGDPLRHQIKNVMRFDGGEGCAYAGGHIYFSTKGDNRIWDYDIKTGVIRILYDLKASKTPALSGVDNIAITPSGALAVAEDGGNGEIVMLSRAGQALPLLRLIGHDDSELTGPAFSPDGTRLYFSSQRGTSGKNDGGMTFEIHGDFNAL